MAPVVTLETHIQQGRPGQQCCVPVTQTELYALLIAVQQIMCTSTTAKVTFVTDSQFVANQVTHIVQGTYQQTPHKSAHWAIGT